MAMMRTIASKLDKARDEALAWIPSLQEEVKTALIVEIIEMNVRAAVPWITMDAIVNNITSRVSATLLEKLDVNQASQSHGI